MRVRFERQLGGLELKEGQNLREPKPDSIFRRRWALNALILILVLVTEALCIYFMASDGGRMFLFHLFGITYPDAARLLDLIAYFTLGLFAPFVVALQLYPKLKLKSKLLKASLLFLISALMVVLGFGIYGTVTVPLFLRFSEPRLYGGTPHFFLADICFDCSAVSSPGYILYTFFTLIVLLAVAIYRASLRIFGKQNI